MSLVDEMRQKALETPEKTASSELAAPARPKVDIFGSGTFPTLQYKCHMSRLVLKRA